MCTFQNGISHHAHRLFSNCHPSASTAIIALVQVPDLPTSYADTVETTPTLSSWVDSDTATADQTKTVNGTTLTLVFSDEFNDETRDFGYNKDAKWEAVDLHYRWAS